MRRLPVYLVLDVSGSMSGEPIEAVKNGLQLMHSALRKDPQALEMAYISIITFATDVSQIVPLTEVASFKPPAFSAGGGTSLGKALKVVTDCAKKEVAKSTLEEKGDYKPLVFLMTDGQPTDSIDSGLNDFKAYSWGVVVACAAGTGVDNAILQKITNNILLLDTCDTNKIAAFFKYVSSSISTASKKVDADGNLPGADQLPPPPPEISLLKL
ncbi:MAG: VWA domain-containing protein [Deltaproteobacteria bacterium]|jgi:uncharacterized protein YegL|nr:VWA domain-containing protein [Deltaproteobacteria bacterium]